jgi:hypothetical protein
VTAFLTFLAAMLTSAPELIAEVEKLIADLKSPASPLGPKFASDSAAADKALFDALKK